jgi:hypothetical protein
MGATTLKRSVPRKVQPELTLRAYTDMFHLQVDRDMAGAAAAQRSEMKRSLHRSEMKRSLHHVCNCTIRRP